MTTTLAVVAMTGLVAGTPSGPSWERLVEKAAFSPRDTAEGVVFAGKLWLSNAYHVGNVLVRDLWNSADGLNWTRVSDATPYDGYAEMSVYHDRIWAVKASVWNSADGVNWSRVAEKTPFGTRGYGETVVFKDRLFQLGSGSDVWSTTDGITWVCHTKQAAYGQRAACGIAVFKGRLWLLGGRTPGPNDPPEKGYKAMWTRNDVWSSEDGEHWTRLVEHAPWAPRQWHIAEVYRDRLWIIGGHDNVNSANLADVWYSEDGVEWHEYQSEKRFSPRHEVTTYVFQDALWVVAGNAWPLMNDIWRLKLPTDWLGRPAG